MGLIDEGLTIEGEPVTAGGDPNTVAGFARMFEHKLAAEPEATPEEREPAHPDRDSDAAIKAQILGETVSTSVKDGLVEAGSERSSKYGFSNDEARRIHREYVALGLDKPDPDTEALQYGAQADQIELKTLREEKAIGDFKNWYATSPDAMDDQNVVERLAAVRAGLSEDAYMTLVSEVATGEKIPGSDEEIQAMYELDTLVEEHAQLMQAVNEQAEREQLTAQQMQQSSEARAKHLAAFAKDNRLSSDQAMERFEKARALHFAMRGEDLAALVDPTAFNEALRYADSYDRTARANAVARRFKQQLLDEPVGVSDGIEVFGSDGRWHRPNEMVLPPASVDPERVAQRASTRRETVSDIKRSFRETAAESEYRRVQKIAGELFEKAAPKPQRS